MNFDKIDSGLDLDEIVAHRELASALHTALARLPEFKRRLLELVFVDGATHVDAAEELGITRGAVQYHLTTGLGRLAKSVHLKPWRPKKKRHRFNAFHETRQRIIEADTQKSGVEQKVCGPAPPTASHAVAMQMQLAKRRLAQATVRTYGPPYSSPPPVAMQQFADLRLSPLQTFAELRQLESWWISSLRCVVLGCSSILYCMCHGIAEARRFGTSNGWHCAPRFIVCPSHLPLLGQIRELVSQIP